MTPSINNLSKASVRFGFVCLLLFTISSADTVLAVAKRKNVSQLTPTSSNTFDKSHGQNAPRFLSKLNDSIAGRSLAIDTDGDGVDDTIDLDDDNDGILDEDESVYVVRKFNYQGTDQTFIVPADVEQIEVKVWGAGGGGSNYQSRYSTGGAGGFVSGFLDVSAGETYTVMVGQGGVSDNNATRGPIYGFGGERTAHYYGSFGGGLSGLFTGSATITETSQSRAILIAGGGGAGERSTIFTTIGGQGGDAVYGGGSSTMHGGNDTFEYGGGGGGGYSGGLAEQTRLSTDPANAEHGEGGSNYIDPAVTFSSSLSTADLSTYPDPYAISINNPPNTTDVDYVYGVGVGTSNSNASGGNGLVVIRYLVKVDTDNDGIPDFQDLDSDGDGCSDANEAYGDPQADGGDSGIFGAGTPTLSNGGVDANGLVIAAGINTAGDAYTNTIQTVDGKNTFQQGMMLSILTDPFSLTAEEGSDVLFYARGSATPTATNPPTTTTTELTFAWQVSTDGGNTYSFLPNGYGNSNSGDPAFLKLENVTASMHGNLYRVLFFSSSNTCFEISSPATLNVLASVPSLSLEKSATLNDENGDGFPQAGETITYDFTINNTGDQDLSNIVITDALLGGDICTIPFLAAGATSSSCSATYTLTQTDIDNGFIINQAQVTAEDGSGNIIDDLSDDPEKTTDIDDNADGEPDDPTTTLLSANPKMLLFKRGIFNDENSDEFAQPRETISYFIEVINTGNVTLEQIHINDPLLGGEIGLIPSLRPDEVFNLPVLTYTIQQEDVDNEEVFNQAYAEENSPAGAVVIEISDDPDDVTETDLDNDGDADDPTIIRLNAEPASIEIFNALTPNNDGLNDYFKIKNISDYPDNNVQIFNRWGVLVWEIEGYDEDQNIFKGISNGRATIARGERLPSGTYFYVIVIRDASLPENEETCTGYLYINN